MTGASPPAIQGPPTVPTIWGLTPAQIHDRFWASRGVQVVRQGEPSEIVDAAELFLLIDPKSLVVFSLRDLVEVLSWLRPKLVMVRIRDTGHEGYREVVRRADDGRFLEFQRIYEGLDSRLARVGLTPYREVARLWQDAATAAEGWMRMRRNLPAESIQPRRVRGHVFDASRDEDLVAHLECLMDTWANPASTVSRVAKGPSGTWVDREATVPPRASVVGRVWVGAGRRIEPDELVVGPAMLWDDPASRPSSDSVPWQELEPISTLAGLAAPTHILPGTPPVGKRLFDILFSLFALVLTLPFYPFIALAILIEDGWPVFFAHRRETLGGREFPCLKFRSMRRDADKIKSELRAKNLSDGPQFFLEKDPRSTRVGRFLRTTQIDELPQFLNVLVGQMSVVGPRPSPRRENQFCPAWREARLSVRPGVTGLWQTRRTRAEGLDFQEWIRFDLEYVENMSWALDLKILWNTIGAILRRGTKP